MSSKSFTIVFRKEEESWHTFIRKIHDVEGELLIVLSPGDANALLMADERDAFFEECAKIRYRLRIAVRHRLLAREMGLLGISAERSTRSLRRSLREHPQMEEALRHFSPHMWRQQWRSRLQGAGLLSVPRVRIAILIGLSFVLFLFVVLRLLPSAQVRVWPRQDTISETMNIYLLLSGATIGEPTRVRTLPLYPFDVTVHTSLTFDQISKVFTGTDAEAPMTIYNVGTGEFILRKGSRLVNQAGMVFHIAASVDVPAGGHVTVKAKADPQDLYRENIGERGNVPAGLRWDFVGLSPDDRKVLYAVNTGPGKGGMTASKSVFLPSDLQSAVDALKQSLLAQAKKLVEEHRHIANAQDRTRSFEFLTKSDVTHLRYSGFVLPVESLNHEAATVTVSGNLTYRVFAYDIQQILSILRSENAAHLLEGKQLMQDSLTPDRLRVYVIAYADDLTWIKITTDLAGTEEFILDPLTLAGARFSKRLREQIAGLSVRDALRIVRNLPEIQKAEISVWPPWSRIVPMIPTNIEIVPQ
ncbi:hypothetical protein HY213_03400 [Candidatus Peregrinibacteria bacterium]|nr:hypothetical protein [Candidatus Peregrinibacteria bacterium]